MPSHSAVFAMAAIAAAACNQTEPTSAGATEVRDTAATAERATAPAIATPAIAKAPAIATPAAKHSEERPVLIVFSRDYCTPCQIMKPWVAEIAAEHPGIDVVTINVDRKKYEHIGSFFKVAAVPSLIFAEANGEVVRRSEGLAKKEKMSKALQELAWVP